MRTLVQIVDDSERLKDWEREMGGVGYVVTDNVNILASAGVKLPSDVTVGALTRTPGVGHTTVQYLAVALADEVVRLNDMLSAVRIAVNE